MDIAIALGLGALAGGLVAFVASIAHRSFRAKVDDAPKRLRLEVIGCVLGATVAAVAAAFLPVPWAVALGALSPLVIPPIVFLLSFPFRPR